MNQLTDIEEDFICGDESRVAIGSVASTATDAANALALIHCLKHIIAKMGSCMESLKDAEDVAVVKQQLKLLLANAQDACDKLKEFKVEHKYSIEIVIGIVVKGTKLFEAGSTYKAHVTKPNFANWNKSVLAWGEIRIPRTSEGEVLELARKTLATNSEYTQLHVGEVVSKVAEATADLKAALAEKALTAGGLKNGSSWKETIAKGWELKQILKHAELPRTGLLAGPGKTVQATKAALKEANQYTY